MIIPHQHRVQNLIPARFLINLVKAERKQVPRFHHHQQWKKIIKILEIHIPETGNDRTLTMTTALKERGIRPAVGDVQGAGSDHRQFHIVNVKERLEEVLWLIKIKLPQSKIDLSVENIHLNRDIEADHHHMPDILEGEKDLDLNLGGTETQNHLPH